MHKFQLALLVIMTLLAPIASSAPKHGAFQGQQVFDETIAEFVTPQEFWQNYAHSKGGLTWGESDQYPSYSKVEEFDLFMVRTVKGPCLMEFFHGRWRRAQDVRRWNPEFNEVLGCPYVFD